MSGAGASAAGGPPREAVRRLPKLDLHCHLDGAARPATLFELARASGSGLPAGDLADFERRVRVAPGCRTLREFLATFEAFYPLLRAPGAMARLARELCEDAAADGVVHLELRFCPALQADGPAGERRVLREVLDALAVAGPRCGLSWGVIVCCYRPLPPEVNGRLVELALRERGAGVVGVDLAGPEDLPGAPHAAALERARAAGLPITIHAGEAAGPHSVREALEQLHARRLGHAVALREDAALAERVRRCGVSLECCLSSNLCTGAVGSLAEHPLEALRAAGLRVTLNTDDPAVCGTTLTDEYLLAARTWGYDLQALAGFSLAAVEAAFVDEPARRRLRRRVAGGAAG